MKRKIQTSPLNGTCVLCLRLQKPEPSSVWMKDCVLWHKHKRFHSAVWEPHRWACPWLTLKILKLFWGSSISCLMAKCILCLFLRTEQWSGFVRRSWVCSCFVCTVSHNYKMCRILEGKFVAETTGRINTDASLQIRVVVIHVIAVSRWSSHPENRSRGQYRLRLFHFALATWSHTHTTQNDEEKSQRETEFRK